MLQQVKAGDQIDWQVLVHITASALHAAFFWDARDVEAKATCWHSVSMCGRDFLHIFLSCILTIRV